MGKRHSARAARPRPLPSQLTDSEAAELSIDDRRLLAGVRRARADNGQNPHLHDPRMRELVLGTNTRETACDGKAKFAKPEHAAKAARDCTAKYGEQFRYYACPFCTQYHLTTHLHHSE